MPKNAICDMVLFLNCTLYLIQINNYYNIINTREHPVLVWEIQCLLIDFIGHLVYVGQVSQKNKNLQTLLAGRHVARTRQKRARAVSHKAVGGKR